MRRALYERTGRCESRLKYVLKNHPYSALFMLFILIFGCATGVSTSLIFGDCGVVIRAVRGVSDAGGVSVTAVVLRMALFNFSVAAPVSASVYYAAFYPFACLSVMAKGLFMGVGFGAGVAEMGASGAAYGVVCIALPSIVTLTGLMFMFINASAGLAAGALAKPPHGGARDAAKSRFAGAEALPGGKKAVPFGLMLVFIGSLAEAGLQLLFTVIFPW